MMLNLALLWLLTSVVGLHYLVSTMISFFCLMPVGFWLQKLITFRTPRAHAGIEWPRYFWLALYYEMLGVWLVFGVALEAHWLLGAAGKCVEH